MDFSTFNTPRSTPWSDWDEWTFVRLAMSTESHHMRTLCVDMISLWRIRGKLPVSVDCTGNLIEVTLNDEKGTELGHSENMLRLQYGLVLIRSINGLVDPAQQGLYAGSVLSLAEQMGLPGWLVELRHDATHNDMPSLTVLRAGAQYLLHWLRGNYWDRQAQELQDTTKSLVAITINPSPFPATFAEANVTMLTLTSFADLLCPFLLEMCVDTSSGSMDIDTQWCSTWTAAVKRIVDISPPTLSLLIVRVAVSCANSLEKFVELDRNVIDGFNMTADIKRQSKCLEILIDHVGSHAYLKSAVVSSISTVLARIRSLLDQVRTDDGAQYRSLCALLESFLWQTDGVISDISVDTEVCTSKRRKRTYSFLSCSSIRGDGSGDMIASEYDNVARSVGWEIHPQKTQWPLGLLAGYSSNADLRHITEIKNQRLQG